MIWAGTETEPIPPTTDHAPPPPTRGLLTVHAPRRAADKHAGLPTRKEPPPTARSPHKSGPAQTTPKPGDHSTAHAQPGARTNTHHYQHTGAEHHMHTRTRLLMAALTAALRPLTRSHHRRKRLHNSLSVEGSNTISAQRHHHIRKSWHQHRRMSRHRSQNDLSGRPEENRRPTRRHKNHHNRKTQRHELQIVTCKHRAAPNHHNTRNHKRREIPAILPRYSPYLPTDNKKHKSSFEAWRRIEVRTIIGNVRCLYRRKTSSRRQPGEAKKLSTKEATHTTGIW